MKSIKELKANYYFAFVFNIILIMMMIIPLACILISDDIFGLETPISQIISYTIGIVIIIGEIWLIYKFILCLKDLPSVINNNFTEMVGTVYRYARNESETGQQLNNYPKIKILNSDLIIELFVNKGTEINKTYRFIYLKNTKIGAVKEDYQDK